MNFRLESALPKSKLKLDTLTASTFGNLILVLSASLILGAASQFSFTIPYTTIPVSLQPHAVLGLAAILGPYRALSAVALFLCEGALGLPVFAHGFFGAQVLMGTHGGYLLSYLYVSFIVGLLFKKLKPTHYLATFGILFAGMSLILISGTLWLSGFVGLNSAVTLGFTPFLLSGLIKTAILTKLIQATNR